MKIQTPLYITPHHSHTEATAAFGALKALHGAYPALRFGMVYHPPRWLVFRVHEQGRQAAPLPVPDLLSDGLADLTEGAA